MGTILRLLLIVVCSGAFAMPLAAASSRLYLKDGTYHVVREYQVQADRVRFYSVERGEWEEIPLDLIDLDRTRGEQKDRQESLQKEASLLASEDAADRERRRLVSMVPMQAGVYWIQGSEVSALKQAESKVVNNKRRSILKVLTPIPIVAGKATVELDGAASQLAVSGDRPEFFFRLANEERFTLLRLTPKKDSRVVQTWNILPVSNELIHEHQEVEIFRQQVGDMLYKVWPMKALEPGEYAWVEYTEGKGNIQIWDFSIRPAGRP